MTMQLNPVTRGDLRSRLSSPKILWGLRVYVAALGVLAVFALPPESGRIPGLSEAELVPLFLVAQLVAVAYFTSALAVGEVGVEGEKDILDLAVTGFAPRTIALGKLWTAACFAAALVLVALPLVALVAPPDPAALPALGRALGVTILLAVPLAVVGTWLGAAVSSDFLRTMLHWSFFLGVYAATRWLADPLVLLNPLRLVTAAYRGTPPGWPLALVPHLVMAAVGTGLIARRVTSVRHEGAA